MNKKREQKFYETRMVTAIMPVFRETVVIPAFSGNIHAHVVCI